LALRGKLDRRCRLQTQTTPELSGTSCKNLRGAVKHLSDRDLDLLQRAALEEMKRGGNSRRVQFRSNRIALPRTCRHPSDLPTKRLHQVDKISTRPCVDIVEVSLTRGQVNAVRSAFSGHTPSRIGRQFMIAQSNMRKALAMDGPKR
jgi:hypothetical protein